MIKDENYYDVCVIGGGPAGATSAYYLAKGGLKVLLIEKQQYPHDVICGDVVGPSCFPILKEMGVLQELLQEGIARWSTARGLKSPSGNSFVTEQSTYQDLIVQRILFDHRMILSANRQNVKVICATVDHLHFNDSKMFWTISCSASSSSSPPKIIEQSNINHIHPLRNSTHNNSDDDHDHDHDHNADHCADRDHDKNNESEKNDNIREVKEFQVFARMIIAADGAESKIAKKEGLISENDERNYTMFSRAFAKPDSHNFRADYAVFHPPHLLPGFFVVTRELEDYLSLCCYMMPGGSVSSSSSIVDIHREIMENNPHIKQVLGENVQLTPIHTSSVRVGSLKKIFKNQFVVVGGAAGHVDPLTGEGIQYAIIGGKLAAKVVLDGFNVGDLSEKQLQNYQKRINHSFGWDLYIASWISYILYKFPLIIDAVAAMIQRNSEELPHLWLTVRTGKRTKFLFIRPDIVAMLCVELLYQYFQTKYRNVFPKQESTTVEQSINTPMLVRQRVRRARRQSLISSIPSNN